MGHGPDDAGETDGTDWQWLGDERRDGPRRPTRWSANDDPLSRRSVLRGAGVAGVGLAVGAGTAGASSIDSGSCEPTDRDGSPPPGPSVLYDDPVTAPQFENGSGWRADPLLVSGAEAHVDGEYLYQDWVFDDYGANTADGDTPPQPPTSTSLTKPVGDVVYPTDDDTYRDNAADLLEFRTRPAKGGVAYRFTLNTMVAPDVAGVAVGIATGEETGRTDWGYGLGDLGAPVDHVLVTWGTGAELDGTTDGVRSVSVDERRNQIEAVVDLDPGEETWQHYCVTGVFDAEAERFKQVREEADEDNPGGARGSNPPPVLNAAFRDEPLVDDSTFTIAYAWRDKAQADALAARDISAFDAAVDFGKLRRNVTDRRVPDSGFLNRLHSSRVAIDGQESFTANEEGVEDDGEDAVLTGRVQPYSVYVPESYDPDSPGPLHVLPHSLGESYNQYAGTENMLRQLGEQRDALVLMFEGRGPAGWWHDEAEFDLFEAWADFRSRYEYDEDRVTLGGYSMGGYGTYRLGSLYPDLFAKGFAVVGPPDEDPLGGPTDGTADSEHDALGVTDNLRHVPLLMWNGANDELVPLPGPLNYARDLREHGYRHRIDVFPGYDHFLFFLLDEWGPGKAFLDGEYLGEPVVTRAPAHVTYRAVPAMGNERFGLVHDGAYWIAEIDVADGATEGLVDAVSHAQGEADPVAVDYEREGTEPSPHTERGTRWAEPLLDPAPRNALSLDLTGVDSVTVWVEEAGIDASRPIDLAVATTTETTVRLATPEGVRELTVPEGEHETTVSACGAAGAP
jgi:predicted esterase